MKKISIFSIITLFALMFLTGTVSASNITVWDKEGTLNVEDNEVTPNCVQGQVWDLEAFWQEGNSLAMIGGYNFKNGQSDGSRTYMSGDIFIDINNDAVWGSSAAGTGGGETTVSNNTFHYDYVIDINDSFTAYSVYALNSDSLVSVYFGQNATANPWRWVKTNGATSILNGNISFTVGNTYGFQGWNSNNTHYLASGFDLSFLAPGTSFLAKYTYECGNDNLVGKGSTAPVPEPATLLLIGSGLLGLAGFRRKTK